MKSPLLDLSLLFFAFIAKQLSAATIPVLDFTGEKLLSGTEYYILSTFQGTSKNCSGLNLFNRTSKTCPLNVIQEKLEFQSGVALTFSHAENQNGVVYESLDLNIKFSAVKSTCSQTAVWRVGDFDITTGQWFITANGVEGNPGAQTLESWFRFEKNSENTYKIRHCPSVCSACPSLCSDVGIYSDGAKRLALLRTPIEITFIKAK